MTITEALAKYGLLARAKAVPLDEILRWPETRLAMERFGIEDWRAKLAEWKANPPETCPACGLDLSCRPDYGHREGSDECLMKQVMNLKRRVAELEAERPIPTPPKERGGSGGSD